MNFFTAILVASSFISAAGAFVQQNQPASDTCRYGSDGNGVDKAQKIMYNQQSRQREAMRYQIIAAEASEPLARRMEEVSGLP